MAWKKLKILGSGSYGSVYLAAPVNEAGGPVVAVKSASMGSLASFHSLQLEANILQELKDCKYVIQGLGTDVSVEDGRAVYNLLLEYASEGSLDKLIKVFNGIKSEYLVASYTYMLLKGLSSIHDKGIVHCDFKPANILVFPHSGISLLKIADFGLSRKMWEEDRSGKSRCTPLYASPESMVCGLNEKAGDIWALGCTVVEMITGKPLWGATGGLNDLFRQIVYENPSIPQNISEDAKDFMRQCLDKDHNTRWTAEMLLHHPFIVKNLEFSELSSVGAHEEEEVVFPTKQWIQSRGMFSTQLKVESKDQQGGMCRLPFALPHCGTFGRIY